MELRSVLLLVQICQVLWDLDIGKLHIHVSGPGGGLLRPQHRCSAGHRPWCHGPLHCLWRVRTLPPPPAADPPVTVSPAEHRDLGLRGMGRGAPSTDALDTGRGAGQAMPTDQGILAF